MDAFIANTLQPIFVALAGALVAALGAALTKFIYTKTGIQISQAAASNAEQAALNAVLAVEEKAAAAAKAKLDTMTSVQKHAAAVNMVLSMVPAVSPEQAATLVNAALARVPGLGASGDVNVVNKEG